MNSNQKKQSSEFSDSDNERNERDKQEHQVEESLDMAPRKSIYGKAEITRDLDKIMLKEMDRHWKCQQDPQKALFFKANKENHQPEIKMNINQQDLDQEMGDAESQQKGENRDLGQSSQEEEKQPHQEVITYIDASSNQCQTGQMNSQTFLQYQQNRSTDQQLLLSGPQHHQFGSNVPASQYWNNNSSTRTRLAVGSANLADGGSTFHTSASTFARGQFSNSMMNGLSTNGEAGFEVLQDRSNQNMFAGRSHNVNQARPNTFMMGQYSGQVNLQPSQSNYMNPPAPFNSNNQMTSTSVIGQAAKMPFQQKKILINRINQNDEDSMSQ